MNRKLVALSFDDGPSNITDELLDILKNENVKATFFLIGKQISEETRSTIEREVKEGHEICNHSFTHSDMRTFTKEEIIDEISRTTSLIEEYAGVTPKFFRPPYIYVNDTMYDNIDLSFICGVDSVDWNQETTVEQRIENVVSNASDGVIYLMHDFYNNRGTLEAVPVIIRKLREAGYEFVTISDLFLVKGINPNVPHKMWSNIFE